MTHPSPPSSSSFSRRRRAAPRRSASDMRSRPKSRSRHRATPAAPRSPSATTAPPSRTVRRPRIRVFPSYRRLILVWAILVFGGVCLGIKLVHLQVFQTDFLTEKAQEQQMIYLRPFVPRRPVIDRNANVIAIDRPVYQLYAHPKLFKTSPQSIATKLAPIVDLSAPQLLKKFSQGESGLRIKHALTEDVADQVAALRLDGLELIQHQQRYYPQDDLFADVVGYVNVDHRGQAGLEYSQETLLERSVQTVRLTRAGNGALLPDRVPGGLLNFDDLRLQLTLDSRLQRVARNALIQQVKNFEAKRGAVLVMDARDGSLLSLVTYPTYNPNQFSQYSLDLFKNWALSDLYEPGSTFKPLNIAIALEEEVITPETTIHDNGLIAVGTWPIKNADEGGRGQLDVAQVLQYSSNVGMVKLIQRLKPTVYYGWLERLGLGHPVGIDLPFEAAGQIKSQEQFTRLPIEPATASFGQGFSLTPIQLLQLQGALANGGKLVQPHAIAGLYDADNELHWQPEHPAPRQLFSPKTAKTVVEMMETVVQSGTGRLAQIPGYRIAGKTGTAQKASPGGGYYTNAKITSFVGILPVDNPRYVLLAVVDEPKGDAFGSNVSAPIVKAVMEALITIEKLPPSTPSAPSAPSEVSSAN